METKRTIDNLSLDGGVLCLDFVNTVHDRTETDPHDYLQNYDHWFDWLEKVQAMPVDRLRQFKHMDRKKRQKVLKKVYRARTVLYRVFSSVARNEQCDPVIMNDFNTILSKTLSMIQIKQDGQEFILDWNSRKDDPEEPIWIIIKSAYDLIVDASFDRIKECEMCGWLFLDKSKNNSRRWCNMQACGSIHKARKYYHRKKRE